MFINKKTILKVCKEAIRKENCDKYLRKRGNGELAVGDTAINTMEDLRLVHNESAMEAIDLMRIARKKLAKK